MEDFIPLWLAIYGRMRGHHRQSNRRLADLSYVPFVHERLLQSFLTKDIESSSKDLQSHLENTDFNRKAQQSGQNGNKRHSSDYLFSGDCNGIQKVD